MNIAAQISSLKKKAGSINWLLLLALLLVLNVKLPLKVAGVLLMLWLNRKDLRIGRFFKQPYLFFYFSMIGIGLVNLVLQYRSLTTPYFMTAAVGLSFWLMSALIAYNLYCLSKKEDGEVLHNTVAFFFMLNIAAVFFNLLRIVIETGSINPYTYKGLNQKYFVSTGDSILGISFDAPVTTAFICAFGLLYFLYRRRYAWSVASMAALIIMASNFANLVMAGVFVFAFIFNSTRDQKSFLVIYSVMLIIFMARISPDNYEHTGRVIYQVLNKTYDLPPEIVIPIDSLKKMPDSLLNAGQRKKKTAQNYIDSISAVTRGATYKDPVSMLAKKAAPDSLAKKTDSSFYVWQQSPVVDEKINRYSHFMERMYSMEKRDSLDKQYNWGNPGKFIAGKQLYHFLKSHPSRLLLGNGIGNFSSRIAFKATCLEIAGRYPGQFRYINADFLDHHLYVYLYFHSQEQSKHEASNTPDTVYFQVLGEYGIIGGLSLLLLYFGFFLRRVRKLSYGLPVLLLLAGAFFAEYWFEQFSIVIVFELLFFLDMKELHREGQTT